MSKKRRDQRAAGDTRIVGSLRVEAEDSDDGEAKLYYFRNRKARRAQARLDGLKWREMNFHERMTQ